MTKKTMAHDVSFLFEMGNLRLIKRMGNRFLGAFNADLADHHFRVFWIAMVLAAHEENVDTGKIAKLALIHDIAESRTGDVDYLARQYVERNEELAIQDMLAGTALQKEFYDLWQEYETRESLESKIVKDADNLDVDFELAESTIVGHNLPDAWSESRIAGRARLHTEAAKQLFDELEHANPHGWHLNGRNRINVGDWGKEKN
jgi:putative hydrolase of HD superfamily